MSVLSASTAAMALTLVAGLGAQQSTVLPRSAANSEGANSTSWPFGLGLPSRIQGIYAASLFGGKPPSIKTLSFRAEGRQALVAKKGVEIEVLMSTSPSSPWNLDSSFAKNVGADERLVFKRRRIDLPASTSTSSPQAFAVRLPLDAAFTYQHDKGALLVEIRVHAMPAGGYELDASYTECVRHVRVGKSCGTFNQVPSGGVAVKKGTTTQCGAQTTAPFLAYALSGGHPGGVALHLISSRLLPTAVPLPYGNCPLHLVPQFSLPVILDKVGEASIRYPLQLAHGKKTLYSQFLSVDLGLTSVRSTPAIQTRLGGWDAMSRLVAVGKSDAMTGFAQIGASWILELGH